MKKIMFNDRYGLTQAVLDGRKTQTRRITCDDLVTLNTGYKVMPEEIFCKEGIWYYKFKNGHIDKMIKSHLPKYKIGEVVAVAQSYRDCGGVNENGVPIWEIISSKVGDTDAGWCNKRFVRADLMPHQIHIIDVRVERLQDITDECCLKEGIIKKWHAPACKNYYYVPGIEVKSVKDVHDTPQEAFAHLINKVSRKDVWSNNPYVFVYDFELIK